jgi:4-oxalocrotonate tautomerase family enzyme
MPTIFFYGPKLNKEKRQEVVKSFTEAASKATGIKEESFVVYLVETARENVGVGGRLLEDLDIP